MALLRVQWYGSWNTDQQVELSQHTAILRHDGSVGAACRTQPMQQIITAAAAAAVAKRSSITLTNPPRSPPKNLC